MKISFIVTAYNEEPKVFKKCLESLKNQSHEDVEIIVVFDGDNLDLEDVAKGHKTVVIDHDGAPKARNAGFDISTGEIVCFWDGDTIMEPGFCEKWMKAFEANPDIDFVYGGYMWTDPTQPGFQSEPFDPWTLSKYNYISTMFPIRREKCPRWDESLDGLQDWDFWRTAVENGCKGLFIPGYHWASTLPTDKSISGQTDRRIERIEAVRRKHGDTDKDLLIVAQTHKYEAVKLAKLLDADYFWSPYWRVRDYRAVFALGFNPQDADFVSYFMSASAKKIIYWMGFDAELFNQLPYGQVKQFTEGVTAAGIISLCDSYATAKVLKDLKLDPNIVPLPRDEGIPVQTLPDVFRVLVFCDDAHKVLMESIEKALPMIPFGYVVPGIATRLADYSLVMQFTKNQRLEFGTKNAILNGRHIISNVAAPYAGYVDTEQTATGFKRAVINRIMEARQTREINLEGSTYYHELMDPAKFTETIKGLVSGLEVVQ